jgi:hypothetical protein
MAGFGQAIHDFADHAEDVDRRHEGGHDGMRQQASIASEIRPALNRTAVGVARP